MPPLGAILRENEVCWVKAESCHFALLLLLKKTQNKEGFIAFVRDLRFTSLSAFFHNKNACYTPVFLKCTESFFLFFCVFKLKVPIYNLLQQRPEF